MTSTDIAPRVADTTAPLLAPLAERWSPRAFDLDAPVKEEKLRAALEAARWAPSANNLQPWRFIVARRGSASFDAITANLLGFNPQWATSVPVLVVGVAERVDASGQTLRWADYDLGQALAHLSIQARHDGLHTHQMGGFDAQGIAEAFQLETRFVPVTVTAVGVLGDPDSLTEELRRREAAPRVRRPLADSVIVDE